MPIEIQQFDDSIRGLRSPRTALAYRRIAETFLRSAGEAPAPGRSDVERFLARRSRVGFPRAPSTRNQELAALRALARHAVRNGEWPLDPTDGIPFAREPERDAPYFTAEELRRLFIVAAEECHPAVRSRNLSILAVLSQAGLRVHEAVNLDVDQVDLEQESLVAVAGKGGTRSTIPISPETATLLGRWIPQRSTLAKDGQPGLFVSRWATRISIRSVERLRRAARIDKTASCHAVFAIPVEQLKDTDCRRGLTLGVGFARVVFPPPFAVFVVSTGKGINTPIPSRTRRSRWAGGTALVRARRQEAVDRLSATIPSSVIANDVIVMDRRVAQGSPSRGRPGKVVQISTPERLTSKMAWMHSL